MRRTLLATHPRLRPADAARLAGLEWDRRQVAALPATTLPVLRLLIDEDDPLIRERLARHPQASAELLQQLARSAGVRVRVAVAIHWQAPAELLSQLAADPESLVRQMVAMNIRTPPEVVWELAHDPIPIVSTAAKRSVWLQAIPPRPLDEYERWFTTTMSERGF